MGAEFVAAFGTIEASILGNSAQETIAQHLIQFGAQTPLEKNQAFAAGAFRGGAFFVLGPLSANSKPTLPFSNFRCAENGRPFFEMNFGSKSVLPVAINF